MGVLKLFAKRSIALVLNDAQIIFIKEQLTEKLVKYAPSHLNNNGKR
jgi:hypothetical protein